MTVATQLDGSLLGGFANGCLADLSRMPGGLYSPFDNTQRGISVVYENLTAFFMFNNICSFQTNKKVMTVLLVEKVTLLNSQQYVL